MITVYTRREEKSIAKSKADIQREYAKRSNYSANKKYDAQNTVFIGLKLNKNTDDDILQALEGKQKQTEIKRIIREYLSTKNNL